MWLLIDNYDSFTYILADYLQRLQPHVHVTLNDALDIDQIEQLNPQAIILSPGPGTPEQAGVTLEVIKHFTKHIPILGICLGHQAIGTSLGAQLKRLPYPMHGKESELQILSSLHPLLHQIHLPLTVMRYHSLCLENLPNALETIATAVDDQSVQIIQHKQWPLTGFQFHPESIGTPQGFQLLKNWAKQFKLI
jgi:anthranilate synthase component 2